MASRASDKVSANGWPKFKFPPNVLETERKAKNMTLTPAQLEHQVEQKVVKSIDMAFEQGDPGTAQAWKNLLVRMEKQKVTQKITQDFIEDFVLWLQGRSPFNCEEIGVPTYTADGEALEEITYEEGTPWGNKPLTHLKDVCEFLDQGIDRRSDVVKILTKLKLTTPRNIEEAWIYYKYLVRKAGIDHNALTELNFYSMFDYPTHVDPQTGEDVTTGPSHPAPPQWNAQDNQYAYDNAYKSVFNGSTARDLMQNPDYRALPPGQQDQLMGIALVRNRVQQFPQPLVFNGVPVVEQPNPPNASAQYGPHAGGSANPPTAFGMTSTAGRNLASRMADSLPRKKGPKGGISIRQEPTLQDVPMPDAPRATDATGLLSKELYVSPEDLANSFSTGPVPVTKMMQTQADLARKYDDLEPMAIDEFSEMLSNMPEDELRDLNNIAAQGPEAITKAARFVEKSIERFPASLATFKQSIGAQNSIEARYAYDFVEELERIHDNAKSFPELNANVSELFASNEHQFETNLPTMAGDVRAISDMFLGQKSRLYQIENIQGVSDKHRAEALQQELDKQKTINRDLTALSRQSAEKLRDAPDPGLLVQKARSLELQLASATQQSTIRKNLLDAANTSNSGLLKQIQEGKDRISELEQRGESQEEITRIRNANTNLQNRVNRKEQELEKAQSDLSESNLSKGLLEMEKTNLQQQLDTATTRMTAILERTKEGHARDLEQRTKEVEELNRKYVAVLTEKNTVQAQFDQKSSSYALLQKQAEQKTLEAANVQTELDKQLQQNLTYQEEIALSRSKAEQQSRDNSVALAAAQTDVDKSRLQAAITDNQAQIAILKQAAEAAQNKHQGLATELERSRSELVQVRKNEAVHFEERLKAQHLAQTSNIEAQAANQKLSEAQTQLGQVRAAQQQSEKVATGHASAAAQLRSELEKVNLEMRALQATAAESAKQDFGKGVEIARLNMVGNELMTQMAERTAEFKNTLAQTEHDMGNQIGGLNAKLAETADLGSQTWEELKAAKNKDQAVLQEFINNYYQNASEADLAQIKQGRVSEFLLRAFAEAEQRNRAKEEELKAYASHMQELWKFADIDASEIQGTNAGHLAARTSQLMDKLKLGARTTVRSGFEAALVWLNEKGATSFAGLEKPALEEAATSQMYAHKSMEELRTVSGASSVFDRFGLPKESMFSYGPGIEERRRQSGFAHATRQDITQDSARIRRFVLGEFWAYTKSNVLDTGTMNAQSTPPQPGSDAERGLKARHIFNQAVQHVLIDDAAGGEFAEEAAFYMNAPVKEIDAIVHNSPDQTATLDRKSLTAASAYMNSFATSGFAQNAVESFEQKYGVSSSDPLAADVFSMASQKAYTPDLDKSIHSLSDNETTVSNEYLHFVVQYGAALAFSDTAPAGRGGIIKQHAERLRAQSAAKMTQLGYSPMVFEQHVENYRNLVKQPHVMQRISHHNKLALQDSLKTQQDISEAPTQSATIGTQAIVDEVQKALDPGTNKQTHVFNIVGISGPINAAMAQARAEAGGKLSRHRVAQVA